MRPPSILALHPQDYINLMAFDFNGPWDNFVGHISPLYPNPTVPGPFQQSVSATVESMLTAGVTPQKIVLVPLPVHPGPGSNTTEPSACGPSSLIDESPHEEHFGLCQTLPASYS